jgi:hypothetical protein
VKYYKGAAWYQKEVTIPEELEWKSINLFLERCHWESRLWIDDKKWDAKLAWALRTVRPDQSTDSRETPL